MAIAFNLFIRLRFFRVRWSDRTLHLATLKRTCGNYGMVSREFSCESKPSVVEFTDVSAIYKLAI
ncbi:MAG: hypothetical protein FWK04_16080 [Nostoc sp. GBBB01]|uniref:Uncharacterized protein n=1 Tax=Nostoc punctiforme FACHB-252 TaxID=1357509 RepID=A0ABR8HIE7_NOSPU|nr:hypothetical protein [Nostoc punctiforme]MBD2614999.1 hypothetical protein [Nostoc punctiforme FACHB-252]MBL1200570.1 hypothetical protein [Nostoc sp. GBBB01]